MQCITLKTILNLILVFMVAFYKGAFCQSIRSDFVLLNQAYTFPGNASSCDHAEWRKRPPADTTIATYKKHLCTIGKIFQEEFTCKDNQLLLKSAKYTDQGPYEFICDGEKTPVNLDVLYAPNENAEKTDNITLSCYARYAKDVTWLHNNERVLHYKMDGSVNPGKGYEKRASLENNCFKTGDLSLTITCVRKEDAGIYRCFVDDETVKGNPHAYVLHVNEKRSGPGDQTHCSCNKVTLFTVVLGLILAIILIYLITTEVRKRQSTFTAATQREGDSPETDRMLMSPISPTTPANESQLVVSYSVQESDSMENKPSNTRPIIF